MCLLLEKVQRLQPGKNRFVDEGMRSMNLFTLGVLAAAVAAVLDMGVAAFDL